MQMKTKFQYDRGTMPENYDGAVDQCLPDDTITIRELMERHVNGQIVSQDLMRSGSYDENADFDSLDMEKVKAMDVVDRLEVADLNRSSIDRMKRFFAKKQKDVKKPGASNAAGGDAPGDRKAKGKPAPVRSKDDERRRSDKDAGSKERAKPSP